MATELESIIARLKTNTSEMRKGFDDMVGKARSSTDKIAQSFDKLGRRVQNIGKSMVLSITTPFAALIGFSVKAASDVQELENLIAVTFGQATKDVTDWADATSAAINRSSDSMLKAAGDFAAFLKPLGVAPDRIVPMSKALSALTTDLASFRNVADQEVLIRLFSGLAGETEAVRRLGIDIGQTAVESELLSMGFIGNAQQASQAQKAIARYNLIIRQTSDAQGDAQRTLLSFENQFKGLGAVIRDIRIAIGNQLLPAATEIVSKLSDLGRQFLSLTTESQRTVLMFGGIAAAIGPVLIAFGLLIQIVGFAIAGLGQFATVAVRAFAMVGRAAVAMVTPLISIPGAIAGIALAIFVFRDTIAAAFRSIAEFASALVAPLVEPLRAAFNFLIEAAGMMRTAIVGRINVMGNLIGQAFDKIAGFAAALVAPLTEPIRQAFQFIMEIAAGVKNFFSEQTSAIVEIANATVTQFAGTVGRILDPIKNSIGNVGDEIKSFVTDLPEFNFERIKTAASDDLNDVKNLFRDAIDGIKNLLPTVDLDFKEMLNIDGAVGDLDQLKTILEDVFIEFDSLGNNMNDHLTTAGLNAKELGDDLRQAFIGRLADVNSLGDAMTAVFDRLKAQLLEIAFFGTSGTGGLFGGIFSSIASGFAGIFGGTRAEGGPVQSGRAFLVGEKGPEMFVPPSAGNIVNASDTARGSKRSGNIIINQTLNFPPDDAAATERMVVIAAASRDMAISAFRQAQNQGF